MGDKTVETRFTIQFSKTDPSHLQVAAILNRQGRRSKAQYLVNAVLHYEIFSETANILCKESLDIKAIEAIVYRILKDHNKSLKNISYADGSIAQVVPILGKLTFYDLDEDNAIASRDQTERAIPHAEEIEYDDDLKTLGQESFNVVVGTLDMFKKKREIT